MKLNNLIEVNVKGNKVPLALKYHCWYDKCFFAMPAHTHIVDEKMSRLIGRLYKY